VVSAGINMLSDVNWNRRNMIILAMSLSIGLGLQAVPKSMQHLPDSLEMLIGVRLTTRCCDFGNFEPVDPRRC